MPSLFEERREIGYVVANATLRCETFTATVAASIIGENAERLRECRHNGRPVRMVTPGTVHKDERVSSIATGHPVDLYSIDAG